MSSLRVTKRRLLWTGGGLLLLGALALATLLGSHWTYIQRIRHYPAKPVTDVGWYEPKLKVPGGAISDIPVAAPSERQIEDAAISNAVNYAEQKNSAALLIVHRGKIVVERYWQGQQTNRWADSASMAKTVTALLIGMAIQEGKIRSIEEPAATYLPAWSKDARRQITIRQLLNMHSGLRPQGEYDDPFSDACYLALGTDSRSMVSHVPLVVAPGTTNSYNNANYQALGFVLEAATGQPYAAYLSQKLWQPLGNADSALWLDKEGGSAHTFGFLFATARDWARIGLLILNEGRWNGRSIVSADWIREMTRASPTNPNYGHGLWIGSGKGSKRTDQKEPFATDDVIYLNGRHKQRVYIVPSCQLVIVRQGEQARGWNETYLVNVLVRGIRPL